MSINMGLVIVGTLPVAVDGNVYAATLSALNGIEPYTWAESSRSQALPPGLTISTDSNGDCLISGTPTTEGIYPIQVLVTRGS
jgi:hypothetical protein